MAYLDEFTDDQRELLVSLPYRAGLWVSASDTGGGEDSVASEMQVLESLITGYAEDYLKSEFVEEVMRGTLANKGRWQEWGAHLDDVARQCREAVAFMGERLESKDVLSFRQSLMEVAKSVAMAYREEEDEAEKISPLSPQYWSRLVVRLKGGQVADDDPSLNISKAERRILTELSHALQVDFDGNPLKEAA